MIHTFSVWNEIIVLHWTGDTPPTKKTQLNWPIIEKYVTFSEKKQLFILAFSLQNLHRVKKQFPNIKPYQGYGHIESLKLKLKELHEIRDVVADIKKGSLANISYKLPPLAKYQEVGTNILTFSKKVPLFADCGCLSGETAITIKRISGSQPTVSLRSLYIWYQHDLLFDATVISYDEVNSCFVANKIVKVVEQGVKPVLKVTLPNNIFLIATPDHEILTNTGWKQVQHLVIEDLVAIKLSHYPLYARVLSVVPQKEEMTYDIVCEDPHRNFVANGMVVHNCGKTYMALVSTEEQIKRGLIKPGKTLVCGKLATLFSGWLLDCTKFTNLKPQVLWLKQTSKRKEKLLKLLEEPADIYIINHDGLRTLKEALAEKAFDKIIVDESTILKGFKGSRFDGGAFGKALMEVAAYAKWRVIMSGTPAPNGPQDLWGQFHFLDPQGFILEKTIHDFRSSFMQEIFFGNPEDENTASNWVPKASALGTISSLVEPYSFRVRIRDHLLDLPEKTEVIRTCDMTSEQETHYEEMAEYLMTEIEGEEVTVSIALGKLTKLRQITSGFIIDNESNPVAIEGDNPKLDIMDSLLYDEINNDEKVVIYAQYQWEIKMLENRYKEMGAVTVYGGNASHVNLENISRFINDASIRLIILHPRSAAHGVTFVVSHYMIFYSISYSQEDNYQCKARIERAGQKHPMFVYYLLCTDSIDEDIYDVLKGKEQRQQSLIDADLVKRMKQRLANFIKPKQKKRKNKDECKRE